jgi:polyisoprenoid-binding protein YceI
MWAVTALVALCLAIAPVSAGDVYSVDKTRSEAKLAIRYLLSTVTGRVKEVGGVIRLDALNLTASIVNLFAETSAIETGSPDLDRALHSAALLDVAKYPRIIFESRIVKTTSATNHFQVVGDFTLHGVTKQVVFSVVFEGAVREPDGRSRSRFTARTTLNRQDYGINWNKVLDQGGVLVGDEIAVAINISATSK